MEEIARLEGCSVQVTRLLVRAAVWRRLRQRGLVRFRKAAYWWERDEQEVDRALRFLWHRANRLRKLMQIGKI